MTTATAIPSSLSAIKPSARHQQFLMWGLLAALLLAHGPLLVLHFTQLLAKSHYQFVWLLPVAIFALAWQGREHRGPIDRTGAWRWVALALPLGLLCLAVYRWSPWLAAISAWLAAAATLYGAGGVPLMRPFLPAWLMAGVVIPLPFNLDQNLIVWLRLRTTRFASTLLDEMGILHVARANVIELPGKPLFVDEACSGILSLFVLIAVALFWALWNQRRWWHTGLLLASTSGVVLVENMIRIVGIAWAADRGWDWTAGWRHELLGLVMFASAALLVLSADQLLLFLLPWRAIANIEDHRAGRSPRAVSTANGPSRRWLGPVPLLAAYTIVALLQVTQWPRAFAAPAALVHTDDLEFPDLGEETLPAESYGFVLKDYQSVARTKDDPMGRYSQQWIYADSELRLVVSLDYPFPNVHDLTICYVNTGWTVRNRTPQELPGVGTAFVASQLSRPIYGRGYLLFCPFDANGQPSLTMPRKEIDLGDRVRDRLAAQEQGKNAAPPQRGPWFQIQTLAQSPAELTLEQRTRVDALFVEAMTILRKRCVEQVAKQP